MWADYQPQCRSRDGEWFNFGRSYNHLITAVTIIDRYCANHDCAGYEWRIISLKGVVWERALSISHG